MANIRIKRQHQLAVIELKEKIDSIMLEIKEQIDFQSEWESCYEFSFRRKGASGRIEIDDTNFEMNINLGIMFRAMKNSIEKRIVSVVDKHFR
jgi:putative polyhydroxyalkanoate system protein